MNTRTTLYGLTGVGQSWRTAQYLTETHPGAPVTIISPGSELRRQIERHLGHAHKTRAQSLSDWLEVPALNDDGVVLIMYPSTAVMPAVCRRLRDEPRDVIVLTCSLLVNHFILPMYIKEQLHEKV